MKFTGVTVSDEATYLFTDKSKLTSEELEKTYNRLPDAIKAIAEEWGMDDTVFRDEAFVWLKNNL